MTERSDERSPTTGEQAGEGGARGPSPARKAPRRITLAYLQRAALHYLERYAAPEAQLRRVLQNRVVRSCRHHAIDPRDFDEMVETVIATCVRIELVDDTRFAAARAATLRRKGGSSRAVAARLSAKGVPREIAAAAALSSDEEELAAARIAAKRKRLGPWSRGERVALRQKHLAALMRAGFGGAIARAVIDGEDGG